jgi:hypothetical protein
MKSQTQPNKPGTGDTVSITVSITQDARKKLREMKGILAYPTLDKTVNTAVEMVEIRKVFDIAMNAHGLIAQIEPQVETKETESSTHEQGDRPDRPDEYTRKIDFALETLEKFNVETMVELNELFAEGVIEIEYVDHRSEISSVGHIPEDTLEWEE